MIGNFQQRIKKSSAKYFPDVSPKIDKTVEWREKKKALRYPQIGEEEIDNKSYSKREGKIPWGENVGRAQGQDNPFQQETGK